MADVSHERPLSEVLAQLARGGVSEQVRAARQLAEDHARRRGSGGGARARRGRCEGPLGGPAGSGPRPGRHGRRERQRGAPGRAPGSRCARPSRGRARSRRGGRTRDRGSAPARGGDGQGRGRGRGGGAQPGPARRSRCRRVPEGTAPRESRWWSAVRLGALLGLAELEDPALVPVFRAHLDPSQVARRARGCPRGLDEGPLPPIPPLPSRLRELVGDRNIAVRGAALARRSASCTAPTTCLSCATSRRGSRTSTSRRRRGRRRRRSKRSSRRSARSETVRSLRRRLSRRGARLLGGAAFAAGPKADRVFINGRVWTGEDKQPRAEALAVRNNLILAVGKTADIQRLAGKGHGRRGPQGPLPLPRIHRRPPPPDGRRLLPGRGRPRRGGDARGGPAPHRRVRAGESRSQVDHRPGLVATPSSPGDCPPRRSSTPPFPTAPPLSSPTTATPSG